MQVQENDSRGNDEKDDKDIQKAKEELIQLKNETKSELGDVIVGEIPTAEPGDFRDFPQVSAAALKLQQNHAKQIKISSSI